MSSHLNHLFASITISLRTLRSALQIPNWPFKIPIQQKCQNIIFNENISLWQALVFCGKWFVKGDFIIVQWVNIKLYVNLSFYFRKVWIGISALMVHLLFEKFHQTFFSFGRMRELFCMINSMQHDIDVFFVRPYIAILILNFTWSGYSLWHANFENITKWNKVFLFHSLQ